MKYLFFSCLFILTHLAVAQQGADAPTYNPEIKWGFVLGFSYGQLFGEASPTDSAAAYFNSVESVAVFGVQAGVGMSIPISFRWKFEPQIIGKIRGPSVIYERKSGRKETYRLQPLRIDVPLHVQFSTLKQTTEFVVGIKPLYSIPDLGNSKPRLLTYDLMGDVGIRRKLNLGVGTYWLELLISGSFINLVDATPSVHDQWYTKLQRREISLRLHFM